MIELQERRILSLFGNTVYLRQALLIFNLKHTGDTIRAGERLRDRDDQVCQLHKLHQNLGHVVDDGNDLTLRQVADINLNRPDVDQRNDCPVDDDIGHRIHDRTDLSYKDLTVRQRLCVPLELPCFLLFLMEGTDDTHTGQIFSCHAKHTVELRLYLLVQRHRPYHDAEHNDGKKRNRHYKDQRALHIDRKRHDHRAKDNDRGTEKESEHHIHTRLHLIDVAGHAGDHGRGADLIYVGKIQSLNVIKQSLP